MSLSCNHAFCFLQRPGTYTVVRVVSSPRLNCSISAFFSEDQVAVVTQKVLAKSQDKGPKYSSAVQRSRILRAIVRASYGAMAGAVPLLASIVMSPSHRSPYLLAYPAVILSAWLWGLPASVACAAVSGIFIEHYIFQVHQINLDPSVSGWQFRESMFLTGSVMVGVLTRSAARQRERNATANLQQKLALAEAEREIAHERELAHELALENQVRAGMALDGANVGIWEWDIATDKSKWSAGFCRLHGLGTGQNGSYKLWRSRIHNDDVERVEASIQKAIAEGGTFLEEYRVALPDWQRRWIAFQGTATSGPDGRAIKLTGFCGDVTRRKLADLALLQAEKLAIAGRLSATIAHEINNPLDAAMNLLYIVREDVEDPQQKVYVQDALGQLERVGQITRRTLQFSRSANRIAESYPGPMVEDTVRMFAPKLQLSQIEIVTDIRQDPRFACYPGELQQALANILSNAIESIVGPGRIRIRVAESVNWTNRSQLGVRISIGDTGSGMSPEVLQRMSEAFFTTKDGTGTGLGMWVVHDMMRKHKGTINVSSSIDRLRHGTVVSLFIPFGLTR